jgi:predicted regulator of Ras-like GTPase activity (Roadblock/LC7/MglB family)
MTTAVVEPWVGPPVQRFVDVARVVLAVLLHPSGQVMAQHGFARAVDVMSACALAAAINASSAELGRQLEGTPFRELHHSGEGRQLFLAPVKTKRGTYLLLTVFDTETSLGLVRLYFEEFCAALSAAAPTPPRGLGPVLAGNFERELNQNLAVLFGRG